MLINLEAIMREDNVIANDLGELTPILSPGPVVWFFCWLFYDSLKQLA